MDKAFLKRFLDKAIRGGIYLLVICVIAGAILFLFLQTRQARDWIRNSLVTHLENTTHTRVHIGALSGNLFTGATLTDVRISSPQTSKPMLTANRIVLSYYLPMLLARTIDIYRLEIDGASGSVVRHADGKWSFASLIPATGKDGHEQETVTTGFTLEIHKLLIHRSRFAIVEQTAGETARHQLDDIECRARLAVRHSVILTIRHVSFTADKPSLTLTDLSGHLVYDPAKQKLTITDSRIRTKQSAADLAGTILFSKHAPIFDMKSTITALSPAEIGRLFSIPAASNGAITGAVTLKGTPGQLAQQLRLKWGDLSLSTRGNIYLSGKKAPGLAVTGRIEHADPAKLPFFSVAGLPGDISADFSINARDLMASSRAGRIRIKVTDSKLAGYSTRLADLVADVTGDDIHVEKLLADTPYGTLKAKGKMSDLLKTGAARPFTASVAISDLNPAKLKGMNPDATGNINLTMTVDGHLPRAFSLKDADVRLSTKIQDSVYRDIRGISGELTAAWKGRLLTVDRLDIKSQAGNISGTGFAGPGDKKCQATLTADLSDMKKLAQLIPGFSKQTEVAGKVSINARVGGTWNRPVMTGQIRGDSLTFDRYHADRLRLTGKWTGRLTDYSASGQADIAGLSIGALHCPTVRIQTNVTPIAFGLQGNITDKKGDHLKIDGRADNWRTPEKRITIAQLALTTRHLPPLVNDGPIRMMLSKQKLTFKALHLVSGKTLLDLSGDVPLTPNGAVSAHLVLNRFNIGRVADLIPGTVKVGGIASADVTVSNTLHEPEITGEVHLTNPAGYGVHFSRINLKTAYKNAKTIISLQGIQGSRKVIDLNGSLDIRLSAYPFKWSPKPGDKMSAHLVLDRFDMAPVIDLLPGGKNVKGRVSADLKLSNSLNNPVMDGQVQLTDASGYGIDFSAIRAHIAYQNDRAVLVATGFRKDKKVLNINGDMDVRCSTYPFQCIPVPNGLNLTLSVNDFSLSELKLPQLQDINLYGGLAVQARITGDISNPTINGDIRVANGHIRIPELGLKYAQLSSDIHITPKIIQIQNISIQDKKKGSLTATGSITYQHLRPESIDLALRGKDFLVPFRNAAFVRAEPDLTLTGPISSPVLKGNIAVNNGSLFMEKLFANHPAEIEVINAPVGKNGVFELPESSGQLSFMKPLAADITVNVKKDVWLKSKEENIEIAGQINLRKNPGRSFVIIGALNATRGTYLFRNHVFNITYGQLSFMGLETINPILNIQARTRVDNAEIIIRLTGTFDNLKMTLSSDPPMDQVDIVSYLMFGRPTNTLTQGENFRAEDAALSITGQLAAEQIQSILGKSFHLDMIHITTGNGNISQGSVSVGKYVAPNVFVTYNQGFSSTNPERSVQVNYEINRDFSIEAQISQENTSAVDLLWHHNF